MWNMLAKNPVRDMSLASMSRQIARLQIGVIVLMLIIGTQILFSALSSSDISAQVKETAVVKSELRFAQREIDALQQEIAALRKQIEELKKTKPVVTNNYNVYVSPGQLNDLLGIKQQEEKPKVTVTAPPVVEQPNKVEPLQEEVKTPKPTPKGPKKWPNEDPM